jgi:hypothetical protein
MPRRGTYFTWLGADVQKLVERAAMRAIDRTTQDAAQYARDNHSGWVSRTGTAEGSIGTNPARLQKGRIIGNVTGGAGDAWYLTTILEVKHGSALRTAADVVFPAVKPRLAEEYRKAGG